MYYDGPTTMSDSGNSRTSRALERHAVGLLVSRAALANKCGGTSSSARCCSTCRWCSAATPPENPLRCATFARIAPSRFPSANSTATTSSAPTTAGNSTRTPANAARFLRSPTDSKLKCERIYAGSFPCEERDGYVWVFMTNPEGRALRRLRRRAARTADLQRALQNRASLGRSALRRGPGHHRPDGSGARPVRASGLVVAQPPQHSRKSQAVRADPQRLSHEPARAFGQ